MNEIYWGNNIESNVTELQTILTTVDAGEPSATTETINNWRMKQLNQLLESSFVPGDENMKYLLYSDAFLEALDISRVEDKVREKEPATFQRTVGRLFTVMKLEVLHNSRHHQLDTQKTGDIQSRNSEQGWISPTEF